MPKLIRISAFVFAATFAITSIGLAAKPKPKPKPAPRTVQGTTQLSGDNAQFGTTYTLGKTDPFNITLVSAEYTVGHVQIGDITYTPNKDEKLLLLNFKYHNPQPTERFIRWDSFGFTVVDSNDQNHDGLKDLGAQSTKAAVSMSMKPAQKMEVYGVMTVPAAGEMPKLIIKSNDNKVLRYDLKGKVKGLPAPFADPADSTGATALASIPAVAGTTYPMGHFDFMVNTIEFSSATNMGDKTLQDNERWLIVKFVLKNVSRSQQFFRWDSFPTKLTDTDGVDLSGAYDVYQASKDKGYGSNLAPGQEITLRYGFIVPPDTDLKTFVVTGPEQGRQFIYDISAVK